MQDAVDWAAARHGEVLLGADRTYLLSSSLLLPSYSHIVGQGSTSVLRFTWSLNLPDTDGFLVGNADQNTGNHDISLDNFAIHGAGDGLPSGPNSTRPAPRAPGIRLRLVDRFKIHRVDVGYVAGISILYQGCHQGLISGNHVHDSGRDGITGTWHMHTLTHITVRRNVVSRVGDDGIAIAGPRYVDGARRPFAITIKNNRIIGWAANPNGLQMGRGIAVLAANRVVVRHNRIRRTVGTGVLVSWSPNREVVNPDDPWSSSHVWVVDNTVIRPGADATPEFSGRRDAILAQHSINVAVRANVVRRPTQGAVVFQDCASCGR
jgi:hypothetical protein